MKQNTFLSLKDARQKKRMKTADFYHWLEQEKIPLLCKPPTDKKIVVGSRKYLELLAKGASSEELHFHILGRGIDETEYANYILYLNIPTDAYKTLFASGVCCISYFYEGLQPQEDGFKATRPIFKKKLSLNRNLHPLDAIFYLINEKSSAPYSLIASVDEIYVHHDKLMSQANQASSVTILPEYRYASKKLEIALETWNEIWNKGFTTTNDRNLTGKESIKEKDREAKQTAKNMLQNLYSSADYHGEQYKSMNESISRLIHPDLAPDNQDNWFISPISNGILGMIQATNYFWSDLDKQYGTNFSREDVIEFLEKECHLSHTNSLLATQIIQPDNITRGLKKSNRP